MAASCASPDETIVEDRLLDGRLRLRQPARGHRAGTDAVLLAAILPPLGDGPLADCGAGVGTVGLLAALAQPALRVALIEKVPALAALAGENIALNGLSDRVVAHAADLSTVDRRGTEPSLAPGRFACVAMNPPFYPAGTVRPSARAHAYEEDLPLAEWIAVARRLLRPRGTLAMIHRAEALPDLMTALSRGFGAIAVRPVQPAADKPATRILVTAVLNGRGPAALLPALVLHGPDGRFTPEAEAIHRGRLLPPQ